MEDHIKTSVKEGRIVFWEEIARDGAQSKTILSGEKRAYFANKNVGRKLQFIVLSQSFISNSQIGLQI